MVVSRLLTRRGALAVSATAIAAMAMAGCGGSSAGSTDDKAGNIAVGNGPFLSNADLHLSDSKGYFKDAGLKVDIKVLTAGSDAVPQLLNNSLQFAAVDVGTAITAVAQGLPIEIVAPNTVGSPGKLGYGGVLVSPASGITSPEGLVGKTVAVNQIGGTAMILTEASLAAYGVDPTTVKFTEVPPPQLVTTLVEGQADSAVLGEPGVTAAMAAGMTHLFNPEENTIPGVATFVYITSKEFAGKHPDVVKSFASSLLKGHVFANANPDEVRTIAAKSTEVPPDLLAKATLPTFGEKAVEPQEIDTWIALLEKYGDLDKAKAPSAASVLGQ
jgi:NitT/TauT family transport system substrate-binding protein